MLFQIVLYWATPSSKPATSLLVIPLMDTTHFHLPRLFHLNVDHLSTYPWLPGFQCVIFHYQIYPTVVVSLDLCPLVSHPRSTSTFPFSMYVLWCHTLDPPQHSHSRSLSFGVTPSIHLNILILDLCPLVSHLRSTSTFPFSISVLWCHTLDPPQHSHYRSLSFGVTPSMYLNIPIL